MVSVLGLNPGVELGLELLERGDDRLVRFRQTHLSLHQPHPVSGGIVHRVPFLLKTRGLDVGLAVQIEIKIVVRAARTLEDAHEFQSDPGYGLWTINLRIVSGRNITRPPTLTREIFFRWTQFL